ncbi:hypothetical protein F5Y07DRAFT_78158 [Xylaria sp. FL0933]|nr:hypothetical protein F5Y07DRAFT_78158 [Xylaria sp. FL0933]
MVRIKERYLLVNILYPTELGTRPNLPDVVMLNQPTSSELTAIALLRAIRAEVAALFGDYGSGALEGGGFSGKFLIPSLMAGPRLTDRSIKSSTFRTQLRHSYCESHEPRTDLSGQL